jgi:aminoglycoside 2'-N-acetyltransferase I
VTVFRDGGGPLVAHATVVSRRLWIDGNARDVGYVEAVATEPDAQGQGFGTAALEEMGRIIEGHHAVGVLSTGACHFYERLGWRQWRGPTSVRLASGEIVRTPDDDGGIMVRSTVPLDIESAITCDQRTGDDW